MKMMLKAPISLTSLHMLNHQLLLGLKRQHSSPPAFFSIEVISQSCIHLQHWNNLAKSAIAQSHFSTRTIGKDYCILDAAIGTEHLKNLVTNQRFPNREHMQICKKTQKTMVRSCIQEQYWEENNPISWSMEQSRLQLLNDQLTVTRAWTEEKAQRERYLQVKYQ